MTQLRAVLFGKIEYGEMILNDAGKMVHSEWENLPKRFPNISVDEFQVMPNHFHGIIIFHNPVGATLVVAPTIGEIIGAFKSITNHRYILGVKQSGWPPFPKRHWQRNYFEHIVRDEEDYERIASYILDNPANWEQDEENPNNPCSDPLHLTTK